MGELWRPIPGYPGYEASSLGRVRSVARVITYSNGRQYRKSGRILRPVLNTEGYWKVTPGKGKTATVHTLVLLAFRGPRPSGQDCRHLNDIRTDNRVENLEYGTRSQNNLDAIRNGRNPRSSQTHCKRGHELIGPNVISRPGTTHRRCRICTRTNNRASFRRRKNALANVAVIAK